MKTKNRSLLTLSIATLMACAPLSGLMGQVTAAGGGTNFLVDMSLSKNNPTVNDTVNVTVSLYSRYCAGPNSETIYKQDHAACPAGYTDHRNAAHYSEAQFNIYSVTASGSGNTISPGSITLDANGRASFAMSSSSAGTKTITFGPPSVEFTVEKTSITFAAAPTPTAPTSSSTKKTTTSTTPTPTAAAVAPVAPTSEGAAIVVDGKTLDPATKPTLKHGKPLVLSGKTVPNGIVTLTVHSTPQTFTTTADGEGNWTYTVEKLETGDHYVEASVTDPATNMTSETSRIMEFSIEPVAAKTTDEAATATATAGSSTPVALYAGIPVLLIVVGGAVFFLIRRKRRNQSEPLVAAPIADTAASTTTPAVTSSAYGSSAFGAHEEEVSPQDDQSR